MQLINSDNITIDTSIITGVDFQDRTPNTHRLDFLDSIRALAASWVVLSHTWILVYGMYSHNGLLGSLTNWLLYSHLPVNIFIVLSGYCLIQPIDRSGYIKGGARVFFQRRARRILPPLYIALSLAVLVSCIIHNSVKIDIKALLANIFLMQDLYTAKNIYDSPLWSVAVEWRIYFLFPLIVYSLYRWGYLPTIVSSIILSYSVTAAITRYRPDWLLSCAWYLFLFTAGVCAGSAAKYRSTAAQSFRKEVIWCITAGLSMPATGLLIAAYPITHNDVTRFGLHMPIIDAATGIFAASTLFLIHSSSIKDQRQPVISLLKWRPLVWLGRISYSLYLMHLPVLLLTNHLLRLNSTFSHASALTREGILAIIGIPMVIIVTAVFYHFAEEPFMKKPQRI